MTGPGVLPGNKRSMTIHTNTRPCVCRTLGFTKRRAAQKSIRRGPRTIPPLSTLDRTSTPEESAHSVWRFGRSGCQTRGSTLPDEPPSSSPSLTVVEAPTRGSRARAARASPSHRHVRAWLGSSAEERSWRPGASRWTSSHYCSTCEARVVRPAVLPTRRRAAYEAKAAR